MSYDLVVYAPTVTSTDAVVDVVESVPGLTVDSDSDGFLTVCRGARATVFCTVEGPYEAEPEDIPSDVTARAIGLKFLLSILVDSSTATNVSVARRFARELARACGGVLADLQTDEIWVDGGTKRVSARPGVRDQKVSIVDIDWYCLASQMAAEPGEVFLQAARQFLPEALPRRFGDYEPFQGKYSHGGQEAFLSAWRDASFLFFFSSSMPVDGGFLSTPAREASPGRLWQMGLTVHVAPLEDRLWRDALRNLLIAVSDGLGAFYAGAQVLNGWTWTGRKLWSSGDTESPTGLINDEGWCGLPPHPIWWSWYGQAYQPLVREYLRVGQVHPTKSGLMHELSQEPLDRQRLQGITRKGAWRRRRRSWLPQELLAKPMPKPPGQLSPPAPARADVVPADIRTHPSRGAELAARRAMLTEAEKPIVAELQAAGFPVKDSVWDLRSLEEPYPEALPIVLKHLQRGGYPDVVMEGLARALAVQYALTYWDQIKYCYVHSRGKGEETGTSVALSEMATKKQVPELMELLNLHDKNDDRVLFIKPILRWGGSEGYAAVESVRHDPKLGKEADYQLTKRERAAARRKARQAKKEG